MARTNAKITDTCSMACRVLLMLTVFMVLVACGNGDSDSVETAATNANDPAVTRQNSNEGSCIAGYAERPCDLLTAELVRQHVVTLPADAEIEDLGAAMKELGIKAPKHGSVSYNGCSFSWDGGRKTPPKPEADPVAVDKVADPYAGALDALKYNRPISDTVAFKSIKTLTNDDPLKAFEHKWRAPTEEERAMLARRIEEKMEETRQEGKLSGSAAAVGNSLGQSLAGASIEWETIEGIGTAARWGGVGGQHSLMVLDADTEFEIAVDVAADESVNRAAAIGLASDLLTSARAECP